MNDRASRQTATITSGTRLQCLFNRHAPAGHRARWNGETYIGRCEHCDAPIFRVKKGKWKRDRRKGRQD
ncbi:hypothetical protein [Aurantiacibacter gilvus]|uniref:DUF951 domain-containing protein n=1 Tax=Aurantiacibacter gilvus TaxID=3139141 RepID=A0ABU9IIQ6_9SPHN